MLRTTTLLLSLGLLAGSGLVHADDAPPLGLKIVTQGASGAPACVACHGLEGAGMAAGGFPRLAGQPAGYIIQQLSSYASGTRADPTMTLIGKALSAEEAAAVASYYAELDPIAPGDPPDPAAQPLGMALALDGDWDRGLPACVQCHGPGGRGVGATFPALAGQHKSYLAKQLSAWKEGSRKGDPGGLMATVATKLTPEEIDAVSEWFAAQPAVMP